MTKICVGCGSILQNTNPNKVGYTPKKNTKLCERCFRLKNYNEKKVIELKYNNEDIIDLLNKGGKTVIFITDFLSLNQKVVDIYKKIKVKNKYFVINKLDYIPYSIKKDRYVEYIHEIYDITDPILIVSATKKINLNELNNIVLKHDNCYIAGFTNSGKSTIINKLAELNGKKSETIESLMPNTTLDVIKLKLNDNAVVYDTPGFVCDFEFNPSSFPKKYLKPVTIQLKENDVIQIDSKIFIKNMSQSNSLTFYMSDQIKIKKVYGKDTTDKLYTYTISDNSDLIISGYGFINIKKSCELSINYKDFEIRNSMF